MTWKNHGRIGLGLAAIGRPAYITAGRNGDLGAIPVATSVIFAVPSSFVKEGACDAGFGDIAPWAMRSIPVWWFFEALNPNEPAIYCPA